MIRLTRSPRWALTGSLLLLALCAQAQRYEQIAPKPPVNSDLQTELPSYGALPSVAADNRQIAPSLHGVRIHRNALEIDAVGSVPDGNGIEINDTAWQAQYPSLGKLLLPYIGQPVSMQSLSEMKREIILFFRHHDRPVVDVILPEQDISNGVVQLVVIESRFGKVGVAGNKYFSDQTILKHLTLEPGQSISAQTLLDDVDWMNTNPFLNVQPVFSPSQTAYSSDIILKVDDQRPLRFYLGYENTGNALSGKDRYLAGFNWGNVFGLGHLFNYQFTMAGRVSELHAHAFSYTVPFANKSKLDIYGGVTETEVASSPFNIEGNSSELGARYTIGMDPWKNMTQKLYVGMAWKRTQNALEFGVFPLTDDEVQRGQIELGYQAIHRVEGSKLTADVALVTGFGGIFSNSSDAEFNSSRTGANNSYSYLKLDVRWLRQLPNELLYDTRIIGQLSADKLLSSEQLIAGGYNSVRGYNEREFSQADNGIIWRNELKLRSIDYMFVDTYYGEFQPFVFTDYAVVTAKGDDEAIVRQDGSAVETGIMWSAGIGLRAQLSQHMSLRAEYGWQLRDAGSVDNGRFHIGTVVSF